MAKKGGDKVTYIADFPELVDIVDDDGEIKFLLFDGIATTTYLLQDITYSCPQRSQLPPNMQIPRLDQILTHAQKHQVSGDSGDSGAETVGTHICQECQNLYINLYQLHQSISEMPDPGFYHILTLWDFHTHAIEQAKYSPIIYFYSVAERGKTRTMKGMTWVARRGIRKGDIKDAQLIRDCTNLRASLAFDMTDFWESVSSAGSRDVILNRYERGLTVSRINRPDRGAFCDTDFYDVFGPTLLSTNEIISDIADTRSIPITMIKSERDFENEVGPEELLSFNEQLVAWRMCHLKEKWEQPKKMIRARLGDIIRPLHQILLRVAPQYEEKFKEIVYKVSETKLTEKSGSLTAEILIAINKNVIEGNVVSGVFACQLVTNTLNKDKDEKEKLKSRKVGNIIKSLGFKSTQTSNNTLGFFYKENQLIRLLSEYGVYMPSVPESPVNPVRPSQQTDINPVQTGTIPLDWEEAQKDPLDIPDH